jgi:hypothetical protein
MAVKYGKHWLKAAKVIAATAEEQQKGGPEDARRGILRGAVHGRGMPVDWVHEGSTLLMVAASRGNIDCMNVLLDEFGAGCRMLCYQHLSPQLASAELSLEQQLDLNADFWLCVDGGEYSFEDNKKALKARLDGFARMLGSAFRCVTF